MNKKEVVVFGFNEEQQNKIKGITENFQASFKLIKDQMIDFTINSILNNETSHTDNIVEKTNDISEKVILFNDFNEEELQKIIKSIREHKDLGCILAVITPTSVNWTFRYLINHLIEEREWFIKNKQGNR